MKMKNIIYIAIALVLFAACKDETTTNNTDIETPVKVLEVKPDEIKEFINSTGTVKAMSEVALKSEMVGKYSLQTNPKSGRKYSMGDKVKKGDVIIRLEDREYENNIALDAKVLDLKIKEQNFTKQTSLHKKGGVTLLDLRNSEVALINARYSHESAILKLKKMEIVAPFNGVIIDIPYYTNGNNVVSGSDMVTMMDYSKMYMEFNLPAKNITNIKRKQKVIVTNYNLPNDTIYGKVSEISPAISTETRTFKGKIEVTNSELRLRPGMFINADIVTKSKRDVIVIPKEIITSQRGKKYVFIADKKSAKRRKIKTGIENSEYVEIIKGLKFEDRLIIEGYQTLRDKSKIKVIR